MEKECECYEEEVQRYRKTDYKPIIYTDGELPKASLTQNCFKLKKNRNQYLIPRYTMC